MRRNIRHCICKLLTWHLSYKMMVQINLFCRYHIVYTYFVLVSQFFELAFYFLLIYVKCLYLIHLICFKCGCFWNLPRWYLHPFIIQQEAYEDFYSSPSVWMFLSKTQPCYFLHSQPSWTLTFFSSTGKLLDSIWLPISFASV